MELLKSSLNHHATTEQLFVFLDIYIGPLKTYTTVFYLLIAIHIKNILMSNKHKKYIKFVCVNPFARITLKLITQLV